MLNNFRTKLHAQLRTLGSFFSLTGLPATFWTCISLFFCIFAAVFYGIKLEFYSLIIGSILLLFSGFFDIVDGQVARFTKKTSQKGMFLDSFFDRISDFIIYFSIMIGNYLDYNLIFIAMGLSLLISYIRSKSESLGISIEGIGIGERAERLFIIIIFGILDLIEISIIIIICISIITIIQRIRIVFIHIHS